MINVNPTAEELNPTDPTVGATAPMEKVDAELLIRNYRSSLLLESDWVSSLVVEKGIPYPKEWSLYRQYLRDISDQVGFPYDVTWPVCPDKP
jgi:hypothetical protein